MKYLVIMLIGLGMTGCVSTDNLVGTYRIGYEDRDAAENRWSAEPGIEAIQENGSTVGASYRYRNEESSDNEEHGVFLNGRFPIG